MVEEEQDDYIETAYTVGRAYGTPADAEQGEDGPAVSTDSK